MFHVLHGTVQLFGPGRQPTYPFYIVIENIHTKMRSMGTDQMRIEVDDRDRAIDFPQGSKNRQNLVEWASARF